MELDAQDEATRNFSHHSSGFCLSASKTLQACLEVPEDAVRDSRRFEIGLACAQAKPFKSVQYYP